MNAVKWFVAMALVVAVGACASNEGGGGNGGGCSAATCEGCCIGNECQPAGARCGTDCCSDSAICATVGTTGGSLCRLRT
jgi:hypothetical protein